MLYRSVGFGTNEYKSISDLAQKAQREIIEKIAAEGSCVIVGRSADQVLSDTHKLFRVFISSGEENRIKRIMERDHISAAEAGKKLSRVDKERAAYYNQRSKTRWGDAEGYDLCVDTDWFGIDGASNLITTVVTKK